jgi:hypothetical protein
MGLVDGKLLKWASNISGAGISDYRSWMYEFYQHRFTWMMETFHMMWYNIFVNYSWFDTRWQ